MIIIHEVACQRAMTWNSLARQIPAKIEANCTQIPREKGHHSTIQTLQAILRLLTGKLINFGKVYVLSENIFIK